MSLSEDNKIGKKFGRWTVVRFDRFHVYPNKSRRRRYICRCECGTERSVLCLSLSKGESTSCGCKRTESCTKHGFRYSSEYQSWKSMKARCNNPTDQAYERYGGRGIKVCDRWKKFENFYKDMGKRPSKKYSIDRIDNDGNYCPENCRWATKKEQHRNKSNNINFNGECALVASRRLGGCDSLVFQRVSKGWSKERAFTEPVRIKNNIS